MLPSISATVPAWEAAALVSTTKMFDVAPTAKPLKLKPMTLPDSSGRHGAPGQCTRGTTGGEEADISGETDKTGARSAANLVCARATIRDFADKVEKSATRRVRDGFFLVGSREGALRCRILLFEDWRL
jgi:hypothetical protein